MSSAERLIEEFFCVKLEQSLALKSGVQVKIPKLVKRVRNVFMFRRCFWVVGPPSVRFHIDLPCEFRMFVRSFAHSFGFASGG